MQRYMAGNVLKQKSSEKVNNINDIIKEVTNSHLRDLLKHVLAHGTGMYWEKARYIVDLKTPFPLKLNLWITINGTKDPAWI